MHKCWRKKKTISQICLRQTLGMCLQMITVMFKGFVCVYLCVCAVSTDAAASASTSQCCTPRAPGTSRCPQLDHGGSWVSEADWCRPAGVHPQPHRSRPAGHVQVLLFSDNHTTSEARKAIKYLSCRTITQLHPHIPMLQTCAFVVIHMHTV